MALPKKGQVLHYIFLFDNFSTALEETIKKDAVSTLNADASTIKHNK